MELHEKSLEANITHELLKLADCWYWFLTDIPLWRYWRPRYRLPFLNAPKSTAVALHITHEGKDDPTGNAGGGYDMRIKTGVGDHLLFIQFKKGEVINISPNPTSEFAKPPHEHFKFKINTKNTNQHFLLRNLASGIGAANGNAVVYAFPLIADIDELEANAGKLLRKTKFISVSDIDRQSSLKKKPITKGNEHNFRIGKFDMNRCEVNYFFFFFDGIDRTPEIVADTIAIRFQKTISYYLRTIQANYREYNLSIDYIPDGLLQSFIQYFRHLLHYFEVSPFRLDTRLSNEFSNYFIRDEFDRYENFPRDVEIMRAISNALGIFADFITNVEKNPEQLFYGDVPQYQSQIFVRINSDGLNISLENAPDILLLSI
jgi:hypothetical protein